MGIHMGGTLQDGWHLAGCPESGSTLCSSCTMDDIWTNRTDSKRGAFFFFAGHASTGEFAG